MKLHRLRIFESISRHLNITNAANELNMSQPAVSMQLKLLEQEYGTKFYARNNHGVELTLQGQAFLAAVRPILAQLDKLDMEFRGLRNQPGANAFVVGGSNTLSATVLPEVLVEFQRRHPDANLMVETADSRRVEALVESGKVEVALIAIPSHIPSLEYEPYMEHEAVAFTAPGDPLCERTLSLDELIKAPLVVRKGSSTVAELRRRGYKLRFAAQFGAIESVKTAVRGGMGVGILYRSRVEQEIMHGELRMIDVPALKSFTQKSFITYGKHAPRSAYAHNFIQILRRSRGRTAPRSRGAPNGET